MPKRGKSATSIDADVLRHWKVRGVESVTLDARLAYTEIEGVARYVRMMHGVLRVYPGMLPTQASGRWSTTGPPLVNFPSDCVNPACSEGEHPVTPQCWSARDTVGPDSGWWWLHYDLDAIEGKVADADAGDTEALEAYAKGWDVHTIRACRAFKHSLPPDLTKQCHTTESCRAWRESWVPAWSGVEDRRRHLIKTLGYATQYALSPKGVLQARDIEKLDLTPDELVRFAKVYLQSRPVLVARKNVVWDECARAGVSYSWYGRRRRLYGDWETRAKEGWSHRVSATVTDLQNEALIAITRAFPACHLVLNSHDGLTLAFPAKTFDPEVIKDWVSEIVEQPRTSPSGHTFISTAAWEWVDDQLVKRRL